MALALHVLKGKFNGQEFLLPERGDFVLHRTDNAEVVFDQSGTGAIATITVADNQVSIRSTADAPGLFVNRTKVESSPLKEGDRIRIGTTQLMLVAVSKFSSLAPIVKDRAAETAPAPAAPATPPSPPPQPPPQSGIIAAPPPDCGSLEEYPFEVLMSYHCARAHSGVLTVMVEADMGAVSLSKGQVVDVFIASSPLPNPRRALFRLFRWRKGEYTFNPEEKNLPPVLNDPMDALIAAAVRERQCLEELAPILPPMDIKLTVGKFQPGGLNKLTPAEMFILGLVRMHGTTHAVIDSHPENDLVVCTHLANLMRRNVVCVSDSL